MAHGDRVTFSVIIPTSGRASVRAAFASAAEQLEPGDEILVRCSRDGDFGNSARQSLVERAAGTHLVFMDDDDQFARGAFTAMRRFAREHPGRVGIFRLRYLDGRVLWREPELRRANVSTQMFCVPNVPDKLGSWTAGDTAPARPGREGYSADYEFVARTCELMGPPIFREEVVAHIRADRRGWVRPAQRVVRVATGAARRLRRLAGR